VLELRLEGARRTAALELLRRREGLHLEDIEDVVYVYGQAQDWTLVLEELAEFQEGVRLREATLEDVFLQLTGRGLYE